MKNGYISLITIEKENGADEVSNLHPNNQWVWKKSCYVYEGVIHYEFLPNGQTIIAHLYCEQLDCVYEKVKQKYPELINRRLAVFQKLEALNYSLIHHTLLKLLNLIMVYFDQ